MANPTPIRFPLLVGPENRSSNTNKDAKLVNGFIEKVAGTDADNYHVIRRPGTTAFSSQTAAVGQGLYNWLGDVYSIFGSVLYKNGSSVGTGMDTSNGVYTFSTTLGTVTQTQSAVTNGTAVIAVSNTQYITVGGTVTFPTTTGSGLVANQPYYVVVVVANTSFEVSLTLGGVALTPTSATISVSSSEPGGSLLMQNAIAMYAYNSSTGLVVIPKSTTVTPTGTVANGSAVVTGLSSTVGIAVKAAVSGNGIPLNTTVQSVDSSTQITMTNAVTGLDSNVNFTSTGYNLLGSVPANNGPNGIGQQQTWTGVLPDPSQSISVGSTIALALGNGITTPAQSVVAVSAGGTEAVTTTAPSTINIADTSKLNIGSTVTFSSVGSTGLVAGKTYYVVTLSNNANITVSLTLGGAVIASLGNDSAVINLPGSITIAQGFWSSNSYSSLTNTTTYIYYGVAANQSVTLIASNPPNITKSEVLTIINSGTQPAGFVKGNAYLDGVTYTLATTDVIQGSATDDVTNWPALNFLTADIDSSPGVFLAKQLTYIVAMKGYDVEFFYDNGTGAQGTALAAAPGIQCTTGCKSAGSVQVSETDIFWVGETRDGSVKVMQLSNLSAKPVSTPEVEKLLQGADYTTVWSWMARISGHRFYVLTIVNTNLTLVYDVTFDHWSQWTDVYGNYLPYITSCNSSSQQCLLQHATNGKIVYLDSNNYTDSGTVFPVDIYTPAWDGQTRKKKLVKLIDFIGDQVVGSTLFVRYTEDDYQTWSAYRTVDMSARRPYLLNCGTFRRRAYHIHHQCNAPLRLQSMEIQVELGTL